MEPYKLGVGILVSVRVVRFGFQPDRIRELNSIVLKTPTQPEPVWFGLVRNSDRIELVIQVKSLVWVDLGEFGLEQFNLKIRIGTI